MQCEIEEVDEQRAVLHLSGRLDLLTAARLRTIVDDVVSGGRSTVVVDLEGLAFMDSSGLGALVAGLKTARQASGDLRIAAPGSQVLEVLQLTRLDRVLRPHPSVAEALGAG